MGRETDEPIRVEFQGSWDPGMVNRSAPWRMPPLTSRLIQDMDPFRVGSLRKRPGVYGRSLRGGYLGTVGFGGAAGGLAVLDGRQTKGGDIIFSMDVVGSGPSTDAIRLRMYDRQTGTVTGIRPNNSEPPGSVMFVRGAVDGEQVLYACTMQRGNSHQDRVMSMWVFGQDADLAAGRTNQASMKPTVIGWFQNRLWAANNRANRNPAKSYIGFGGDNFESELYWSALGNGLEWSDDNTILVEPGRGGPITGLLAVREDSPSMVIFKESLITLFRARWGSSSAFLPVASDALDLVGSSLTIVADSFGCVATGSIQEVPGAPDGEIYFLAHDGVRALQRANDDSVAAVTHPISLPIDETIKRINFAAVHFARSGVFNNRYYLSVPLDGATAPSHTIVRDLLTGAWYVYKWPSNGFIVTKSNDTTPNLWWLNNVLQTETALDNTVATENWIYRVTNSALDFSGGPVNTLFETRAYIFDDPTARKRWHYVAMTLNSTNATPTYTVAYRRDSQVDFTRLGDLVFAKEGFSTRKLSLSDIEPGYWVEFRLTSTDYSVSELVDMRVSAELIDPLFDNTQP